MLVQKDSKTFSIIKEPTFEFIKFNFVVQSLTTENLEFETQQKFIYYYTFQVWYFKYDQMTKF